MSTEAAPQPVFRTVAERHFDVEDARGRTYRVTRYVWEQERDGEWVELFDLLITVTGGHLEPLEDGSWCVDGTGTHVKLVPGSVRTRAASDLEAILPAGATGAH
jgi:hypothetical protein